MNPLARRILGWSSLLAALVLHVSHCEWKSPWEERDERWGGRRADVLDLPGLREILVVDHARGQEDSVRWEALRWGIAAPLLFSAVGLSFLLSRTRGERATARRRAELIKLFWAEHPEAEHLGPYTPWFRREFKAWNRRREAKAAAPQIPESPEAAKARETTANSERNAPVARPSEGRPAGTDD